MPSKSGFLNTTQKGYTFSGAQLVLGAAQWGGTIFPKPPVALPLKTMNRHGLIAGATGKGKTKTIQVFIRGVFGVLMKMLK
jgi:hypothetical protein